MDYTPKDLKFDDEGRSKLIEGITKMSNAVKSTLGPSGHTVLIESPNHTHGITVTKDGVTVAKAIDLLDPVENLAVRMMREAADRTATEAGDGTTTSIVLTEALIRSAYDMFSLYPELNKTEVLRYLVSLTDDVVSSLKARSRPLTKKNFIEVASVSSNNDRTIGKIIADVYKELGKNGVVTVENSDTVETTYETTRGVKVERGYLSPLFINNQKRDECILDDCYVLVSDAEVINLLTIESVLKPIIADGKRLLIIAPCSANVVNTLAANVVRNSLKLCAIPPPSFGYRTHELMQDIAVSVGATYFSEKTGDDLSIIQFEDLGHAQRVVVSRDETVIVKGEANNAEQVAARVDELRDAHKLATRKGDKDFILSRIASLTGGIGTIKVGGNTDLEQKELFDRVDDAVCAVRSALQEGILPGGGVALYNEHSLLDMRVSNDDYPSDSERAAAAILSQSLASPLKQILTNAGVSFEDIYEKGMPLVTREGYGFDVKKRLYGDMIEMGIIDPMKVTKVALQNAVSVAATILSTNAIVTMARSYEAS
jgi:chaperonin GroEL